MFRVCTPALTAGIALALAGCGSGQSSPPAPATPAAAAGTSPVRTDALHTRSVPGATATARRFLADMLSGNSADACRLMSARGKASLRTTSTQTKTSCPDAIYFVHHVLAANPKELARLRAYAKHLTAMLHGNTATIPGIDGNGPTTLTFTAGRWYVNNA